MKKIAIITNFTSVAKLHRDVLKELFLDEISVEIYSYDIGIVEDMIDADVLLISLYSIYVEIKKYINKYAKVIILGTTITEKQYRQITKIPENSKVLLVNYSPEMTMETLALFRQVGLTQYDFIPVYPGKKNIPKIPLAVTPGESDKAPKWVKDVIDIGHRTLNIETISDMAVKIGREDLIETERFLKYFKTLRKTSNSISSLLDKTKILESRFFELLNVIDEGIIATNEKGDIFIFNQKAGENLNFTSDIIGTNIRELINHESINLALEKKELMDQKLIIINNNYIAFQIVPVKNAGEINGFLIVVNKFDEKEKNQHRLRSQLLGKGHIARYTFESIIGKSHTIENLKEMARKMSKSDSSILIVGESGVGKELFAQAIHNASNRKEYQFVAVNCGAIPDNLLESELFGYEEGAFTGAKKGGKIGMFELAHQGTLFLDEIGEMPMGLQSRLLRVIQERQVMRIGGDSIIHVDIRIVAATNKKLKYLVKEGKFRGDLFYRLNVLPLIIPPLRSRREDILCLVENIKSEVCAKYMLDKNAEEFVKSYNWEGNVRELRNCIEYLKYLDKDIIGVVDVKYYISSQDENLETIIFDKCDENDFEKFVLETLRDSMVNSKGLGRRKIFEIAKGKGVYITENDIRKILCNLEKEGMIYVKKGRSGTRLTPRGIEFIEKR